MTWSVSPSCKGRAVVCDSINSVFQVLMFGVLGWFCARR